jgi:hypothetical protein
MFFLDMEIFIISQYQQSQTFFIYFTLNDSIDHISNILKLKK